VRGSRPSIFQIGSVHDDGETVSIFGWGIGLCMAQCPCHKLLNGQLGLAEGVDGSLGLISKRPGCGCCEPWSPYELIDVLADFAAIQNVPEVQP
jgi:hypothetical protein